MDLKKRIVGGLVGLVLGAQVLSMSGCASVGKITQKQTWFGGEDPRYSYEKIIGSKDYVGIETISKLNEDKKKYDGKYVRITGYIPKNRYCSLRKVKDISGPSVCTPILCDGSIEDSNGDGQLDEKERKRVVLANLSGDNTGIMGYLYEIPQPLDIIGKFYHGTHDQYVNVWGFEILFIIDHDEALGELPIDMNYKDKEKLKGWLIKFKGFGKEVGKAAGKAAF